ncbi:LOW QUALITY PROTEIN: Hypothetical protein PHPALM_38087 [Phytophthora palmivora]|uniref:DDE-1 domain-containing protein n=1 Tax=Phytophthora palmivora TaxID=4796 RepID=A0A2P4WVS9_9STRA|nr:LOW QUALITY PROTEIN: Hypothetical protein PHPALM_38087 [Phytophthora palmivora]
MSKICDSGKYGSRFTPSTIYNVDETAIYFDTPPKHIWAERDRKVSAKVKYAEKHSSILTVVMAIRADGKPGGTIEQGHIYCVQENGWMDSRVWEIYAKELLKFQIDSPSVLLADNFDCHVSYEGQKVITREVNATVCPLPANSTAVCQPLDVGVMGPLKKATASVVVNRLSEKRLISIERTIRAWALIDSDCVVGSFEKAIP